MTIREDLQAFLSEKPFNNPLTPEELDKLAAWVQKQVNQAYFLGTEKMIEEDDLASKLNVEGSDA